MGSLGGTCVTDVQRDCAAQLEPTLAHRVRGVSEQAALEEDPS